MTKRRAAAALARATHPALQDIDPATWFFWAPRTVSCLAVVLAALVACSGVLSREPRRGEDENANVRHGIVAAACGFLAYSTVQGAPDTVLIRPHPAFWRFWQGVGVLYMLALVYLMFQSPPGARAFLKAMSPSLGAQLQERAYGADCRPVYANIRAMVLDEFVLAHVAGWWAKALMLRHSGMLWTGSILFELCELSFQHWLPNFSECWWDRWLLDVLICNNLGIVAGMWTVRYFKAKRFNWLGLSKQRTLRAKVRRIAGQLLPWSYESFDWQLTSGPRRCLLSVVPLVVMTSCELNAFFLKRVLWVPPRNALNTCRLCIWVGMALPAVKEYYEFITHDAPNCKLGTFAWLSLACFALESLVVVKLGAGLFSAPLPPRVRVCWSAGLVALGGAWAVWALRSRVRPLQNKSS